MSKVDKIKAQQELLARKKIVKDDWADINANVGNKRIGFAFGQARRDKYIENDRINTKKRDKKYDDFFNKGVL